MNEVTMGNGKCDTLSEEKTNSIFIRSVTELVKFTQGNLLKIIGIP